MASIVQVEAGSREAREQAPGMRFVADALLHPSEPQGRITYPWEPPPNVRSPDSLRSALEHGYRSSWLGASLTILSLIGAYLRLAQAGLTRLFWLFLIVGLSAAFITGWRFLRQQRRLRESQRILRLVRYPEVKISAIQELIDTFSAARKATSLAAELAAAHRTAKILAFLYVEGQLGALLDIGAREQLEVGTPLLAYRKDFHPKEAYGVETMLCLLSVTHIQTDRKLAQAHVQERLGDRKYWTAVRKTLRKDPRVQAPPNRIVPFVPPVLSHLPPDALLSIITHLKQVRSSLRASVDTSLPSVGKETL